MASFEKNLKLSAVADSSILTGDIYRLVKVTGVNTIGRAVAATDTPVGVLAEDPAPGGAAGQAQDPAGQSLPFSLLVGRVKVKAGGTVTAGQLLVSDAAGRVVGVANQAALAADQVAVGVAASGGAINEIIEMFAQVMTSSLEGV